MAAESLRGRLARLVEERLEADRSYNQALAALDRAAQSPPDLPTAPPPYDDAVVGRINQTWDILAQGPPRSPRGWRGWLTAFVWGLVQPFFERQCAFNAALVDHLNRNTPGHHQARQALDELLEHTVDQFGRLATFESLLLQFLQRITPYVHTRDRELSGMIQATRETLADVQALADVAQRTAVMAKRELERLWVGAPGGTAPVGGNETAPGSASREAGKPVRTGSVSTLHGALQAYKYAGFEDHFRGSAQEIRLRLADYVPYLAGATDVLDVGCGRGEFLELLAEAGIRARGLDVNHEMVEICRARGLDVIECDAVSYLTELEAHSLGGLFAAQVVEHLEPSYLVELLDRAHAALRPGARIVLETINPACWVAFFESYIRDITHVRPLHPETLKYLLLATGFTDVDIVFRAPVPESAKLQSVTPIPPPGWNPDGRAEPHPLFELIQTFNLNVERLNRRLFTYQDYAAIARRP